MPLVERLAIGTLAAVLAAGAVWQERQLDFRRAEMLKLADASGVTARWRELAKALRYERDPESARLRVARAILAQDFLTGDTAQATDEWLAHAREESRLAWTHRPASAEAAMFYGASHERLLLRRRDAALYGRRADWQAPLEAAQALAPGHIEAARLLGSAMLDVWFALPHEERVSGRELLRAALAEPVGFDRLIAAWLRAAGDPLEAFSVIPARAEAWAKIEGIFAARADWTVWQEAHRRRLASLRGELDERLADAGRRRQGGDTRGARQAYLQALAAAPPGAEFADLAAQALARCPPGAADTAHGQALRRWLDWALERRVYGQPGLEPASIDRLAAAAHETREEQLALAALAAGDLARAELFERRGEGLWSEPWGPYLLGKARILLERDDKPGARQALERAHRSWRGTAIYWELARSVAAAIGNDPAAREASTRLVEFAGPEIPATTWRYVGGRALLGVVTAGSSAARLQIDTGGARGGVVELRCDGVSLGTFTARAGDELAFELSGSPGLHLLEIATVAGERVAPGALRLSS